MKPLLWFAVCCSLGFSVNGAAQNALVITAFQPNELIEFRKDTEREISLLVSSSRDVAGVLESYCEDSEGCEVRPPSNAQFIDLNDANRRTLNVTIFVFAKFLSISAIRFKSNNSLLNESYPLRILRSSWDQTLRVIFTVIVSLFVVGVTFLMGTQLELSRIAEVWKRPVGPITGIFCQFALMPLFAFGLATWLIPADKPAIRLALFACGCSPGGGKSSFWTIIFNGNLDLSVSMTFSETIAAFGMMPLWIYTLGSYFNTDRVRVPLLTIVETLASLMVPVSCGMVFIAHKKHLVAKFNKWVKAATWTATIVLTVVGVYANFYILYLVNWYILLCGCALPWTGYLIAYCTATLFRQKHKERITIAIETGVQHVGITIMMLLWSLPEPEVDYALVMPFVVVIATDKPLVIIWLAAALYRKCFQTKQEKSDPKGTLHKFSDAINPAPLPLPPAEHDCNSPSENNDSNAESRDTESTTP